MRLWADRTQLVNVRWFRAAPGAKAFTGPNQFGSRRWLTTRDQAPAWRASVLPLGEQPGKTPYDKGENVNAYAGTHFEGDPLAYLTGGITGLDPPIPLSADGTTANCGLFIPPDPGPVQTQCCANAWPRTMYGLVVDTNTADPIPVGSRITFVYDDDPSPVGSYPAGIWHGGWRQQGEWEFSITPLYFMCWPGIGGGGASAWDGIVGWGVAVQVESFDCITPYIILRAAVLLRGTVFTTPWQVRVIITGDPWDPAPPPPPPISGRAGIAWAMTGFRPNPLAGAAGLGLTSAATLVYSPSFSIAGAAGLGLATAATLAWAPPSYTLAGAAGLGLASAATLAYVPPSSPVSWHGLGTSDSGLAPVSTWSVSGVTVPAHAVLVVSLALTKTTAGSVPVLNVSYGGTAENSVHGQSIDVAVNAELTVWEWLPVSTSTTAALSVTLTGNTGRVTLSWGYYTGSLTGADAGDGETFGTTGAVTGAAAGAGPTHHAGHCAILLSRSPSAPIVGTWGGGFTDGGESVSWTQGASLHYTMVTGWIDTPAVGYTASLSSSTQSEYATVTVEYA